MASSMRVCARADARLRGGMPKEQNLLMADSPVRILGFKRDFALQLGDARAWRAE